MMELYEKQYQDRFNTRYGFGRKCDECAFDIDMEGAVPCASHKWHIHPDAPWSIYLGAQDDWDMCCLCGKDAEAVMK